MGQMKFKSILIESWISSGSMIIKSPGSLAVGKMGTVVVGKFPRNFQVGKLKTLKHELNSTPIHNLGNANPII